MSVTAAIIVAGGTGSRANLARPKQFMELAGKRMIDWSIDRFTAHPRIQHLVIVGSEKVLSSDIPSSVILVPPGDTRAESVRNGLSALTELAPDNVLIHDAARPGLTDRVIVELLDALETHDAVAPALRVSDALKKQSSGKLETVNRDDLYRVQTPQAFRFDLIVKAHASQSADYVDDLEAVESLGIEVALIEGDERLHKITYASDFSMMETRLMSTLKTPRIGTGYDVHAFETGESVTLCGVSVPHTHKLKGHSDADVAWHALTDAIFGALAAGDIGDHFPPSEDGWKGADSIVFLKAAGDLAKEQGYEIGNCDLTIICEAPKIGPHRQRMRARTAEALGVPENCISVKATTTEKLGFAGRSEGIAAQAAVVLVPRG